MKDENIGEVCQYCGQILLDGECNCDGAKAARKIEAHTLKAVEAIEAMFGDECRKLGYAPVSDESIDIMDATVSKIAESKIRSASFLLPGGVKAKLSLGSKSQIKVERSETKKNSTEIEE